MTWDSSPSADALRSAVRFLRRGVRPDGTHEDGSDWEIASHQWGLFISWAYNRGVSLPASVAPDQDGGPEHDLLLDAANKRWLKFTKPFAAGFRWELGPGNCFVRLPATPLQYLRRWRLLNRLFGSDVRLVGLSCLGRTQRIVTSCPYVADEPPAWPEIDRALHDRHRLQPILPPRLLVDKSAERRSYRHGRLALFDVSTTDCVRLADGRIVPTGANPQVLDPQN